MHIQILTTFFNLCDSGLKECHVRVRRTGMYSLIRRVRFVDFAPAHDHSRGCQLIDLKCEAERTSGTGVPAEFRAEYPHRCEVRMEHAMQRMERRPRRPRALDRLVAARLVTRNYPGRVACLE